MKRLAICLILVLFPVLAGGFPVVDGPCDFRFPADHGSHPDHRLEWWYFTGNVQTEDGRPFGFQLTFFRVRLQPREDDAPLGPEGGSAWRTPQLWLAHAHVSYIQEGRYLMAEDTARGAVGLAGAEVGKQAARVWLKGWEARIVPQASGDRVSLSAQGVAKGGADFSFDFTFEAAKPLVAHGQGGYSQKGTAVTSASCYYSYTRLVGGGTIVLDGKTYATSGQAWMDHEYFSSQLEAGLEGWDWFSLQFDSGEELMAFQLRTMDGRGVHTTGSFVTKQGTVVPLDETSLTLEPGGVWQSPASGGRYPLVWRLAAPRVGLDVRVTPARKNQEMLVGLGGEGGQGVTYWEGSVRASGSHNGHGYLEMTGYAGPVPGMTTE